MEMTAAQTAAAQVTAAQVTAAQTTVAQRLRSSGLRVTRPRIAVLGVLDEAGQRQEHLAVAEVTHRARAALGTLSKQAAYDCLEALAGARLARRIEPAGHPARYEARAGDNHHHLVCRDCGATSDTDCLVAAAPCLTPSATHGFAVDEAEVIFWGRCATCATPRPPNRREDLR